MTGSEPKDYPTPWQRKIIWTALATLSVVAIGAVAVFLIFLASRVLGFLQPILVPFAIAGVLAYLLEPVVARMCRWGLPRGRAVVLVFLLALTALGGILFYVVPAIKTQSVEFAGRVPAYTIRLKGKVVSILEFLRSKYGVKLLPPPVSEHSVEHLETSGTAVPAPGGEPVPPLSIRNEVAQMLSLEELFSGAWLKDALPELVKRLWAFLQSSVGGFLGVFGFLLSMIIVPLYLFYFLANGDRIAASWSDYLPIRRSAFKDEVVAALTEINGYIISFFRGQLIVAMINGLLTGIGLMILGLNFALLIGLMIAVLNLVPYIGIMLCWLPAVAIAFVQYGDLIHPLIVTAIFIGVQQIDGWFITPKIVGDSVGLHPMTVIVAVFVWSLLMGGLLGAILAVPLTATLKVLLKRYIWQPHLPDPTP